jgi:hypothetical protein
MRSHLTVFCMCVAVFLAAPATAMPQDTVTLNGTDVKLGDIRDVINKKYVDNIDKLEIGEILRCASLDFSELRVNTIRIRKIDQSRSILLNAKRLIEILEKIDGGSWVGIDAPNAEVSVHDRIDGGSQVRARCTHFSVWDKIDGHQTVGPPGRYKVFHSRLTICADGDVTVKQFDGGSKGFIKYRNFTVKDCICGGTDPVFNVLFGDNPSTTMTLDASGDVKIRRIEFGGKLERKPVDCTNFDPKKFAALGDG